MGRKLNALEELPASFADLDADQQHERAPLRQQYLARIANALGITTTELRDHPASVNAIQPAIDLVRQNELVLAQQCTDLVKAFVEIEDLQDRLHCLQIVREAAGVKFAR